MTRKDDRTEDQKQTHRNIISGIDNFMSGWGGAKGGNSIAAWACKNEHVEKVTRWVKHRGDMRKIRVEYERVYGTWTRSGKHLHIYVIEDGHPALAD